MQKGQTVWVPIDKDEAAKMKLPRVNLDHTALVQGVVEKPAKNAYGNLTVTLTNGATKRGPENACYDVLPSHFTITE